VSRTDLSEYIGREFETNKSGKCFVVDCKNVKSVIVMFYDGYTTTTQMSNLKRGSVRNPYHENNKLYGVGITDIAGCINGKRDYLYRVWESMITRCYSEKYQQQYPTYREVSVCERWQTYSLFKEDLEKMKCFDKLGVGYHLDKDLIKPYNRIYEPNVYCLIPKEINGILGDCYFERGDLPLGVSKKGSSYRVRISNFGKQQLLGNYGTIREAQIAYWNAKFQIIRKTAILYWNYLPESVAMRFINFGWEDAIAYYGDDARLWKDIER